jgi:hypothetical protein
MKNFFYKKASGVNADLARHTQKQKELELEIAEAEARVEADPTDSMAASVLRVYREFLNKLMDSKANIVYKLGRK